MNAALEIRDVTKVYDSRAVVDHVSLVVERGETFGLLVSRQAINWTNGKRQATVCHAQASSLCDSHS